MSSILSHQLFSDDAELGCSCGVACAPFTNYYEYYYYSAQVPTRAAEMMAAMIDEGKFFLNQTFFEGPPLLLLYFTLVSCFEGPLLFISDTLAFQSAVSNRVCGLGPYLVPWYWYQYEYRSILYFSSIIMVDGPSKTADGPSNNLRDLLP